MINADTLRLLACNFQEREADDWAMLFGIVIDFELWEKIVGRPDMVLSQHTFITGFRMYAHAESKRTEERNRRQTALHQMQLDQFEKQLNPEAAIVVGRQT